MEPETAEAAMRKELRTTCGWFLVGAVVFFPMIMNPVTFGLFDTTKSDPEMLAFIDDHWLAIRLLFTGIGVADLILGVALWKFGRQFSQIFTGKRSASIAAWSGLAGGSINLITRWYTWTQDAQGFFEFTDDVPVWALVTQVVGWFLFTIALVVLGYRMVRGPMSTWQGIVVALCGVLVYPTGFLPLWFYLGAIVLGIGGLRRYRDTGPLAHARSAQSPLTV